MKSIKYIAIETKWFVNGLLNYTDKRTPTVRIYPPPGVQIKCKKSLGPLVVTHMWRRLYVIHVVRLIAVKSLI